VDGSVRTRAATDIHKSAAIDASAHRARNVRDAAHIASVDCWLRFIFAHIQRHGDKQLRMETL
ncbi:hypothetical protein N5J01_19625, partial [Stenotrophomonas sp. GD03701]|uniref:hypothetical protein n=1 Tax=Stenotrophomonas sp. GD03701 TaxID=2975369 RepID=UPI00244A3A44